MLPFVMIVGIRMIKQLNMNKIYHKKGSRAEYLTECEMNGYDLNRNQHTMTPYVSDESDQLYHCDICWETYDVIINDFQQLYYRSQSLLNVDMTGQIAIEDIKNDEETRRELLEVLNATPNEDLYKLADQWRTLNFNSNFEQAIKGKRNKDKIECADELEENILNS